MDDIQTKGLRLFRLSYYDRTIYTYATCKIMAIFQTIQAIQIYDVPDVIETRIINEEEEYTLITNDI